MYCLTIIYNYITPLDQLAIKMQYKRRMDLWEFQPGVRCELLVSDDYIMWMQLVTELRVDVHDETKKLKPYGYSTAITKSKYTGFRGNELALRKYWDIFTPQCHNLDGGLFKPIRKLWHRTSLQLHKTMDVITCLSLIAIRPC